MYYFRYHVKPANNHLRVAELGGAVANVFVDCADPLAAEQRARQYLTEQLWNIVSLDQTGEVRERNDFEHDKMLVDLYQQAKDCGIACVMVAYPICGENPGTNKNQLTDEPSRIDSNSLTSQINSQNRMSNEELDRRATLITERCDGINPTTEAFYIRSVIYSAGRARDAFERFNAARTSEDTPDNQVSMIHEALGHAAALSRFFWPSQIGGRKSKSLKSLKEARATKLRKAFALTNDSPLRNRRLRDFLEHFDERLDEYLLHNDCGYFFPDAMIGDSGLADDETGHVFKLVDPTSSCFVLLGEKHFFEGIQKEVYRIYEFALQMDQNGCRLRRVKPN